MALNIGERVPGDEFDARWRAADSVTSKQVGVRISHEALQDHGEQVCLEKAQEKYDGRSESVRVVTSDF
jgi:hypothetical protein